MKRVLRLAFVCLTALFTVGALGTAQAQNASPWCESFDVQPSNITNSIWEYTGPTRTTDPDYGAESVTDHSGNGGGFIWFDGSGRSNNSIAYYSLASVDLAGLTTAELNFYLFSNNTTQTTNSTAEVEISTNGGASYSSIFSYAGNDPNWQLKTVSLAAYSGIVDLRLKVTAMSSGTVFYNDIAFDDFSIGDAGWGLANCPAPPPPPSSVTAPHCEDFTTTPYSGRSGAEWVSNPAPVGTFDEGWIFDDIPPYGVAYGLGGLVEHTGNGGDILYVDGSYSTAIDGPIELTSPMVDVSGVTDPWIRFFFASNNTSTTSNNTLQVDIWDGAAWNNNVFSYIGNTGSWAQFIVPLNGLTITGDIQARFVYLPTATTNFYNDFAIDDICFEQGISGTPPADPTLTGGTGCEGSSVALSGVANGGGVLYWFDAPAGGTLLFTGSNFNTPALSASTTYYVQEGLIADGTLESNRLPVVATIIPTPAAPTACPAGAAGGSTVTINFHTDSWASESSWELRDASNVLLASGSGFSTNNTLQAPVVVSIGAGNVTFTMFDSFGDGLTGQGYYEVVASDGTILAEGGSIRGNNFSTIQSTTFAAPCANEVCPNSAVTFNATSNAGTTGAGIRWYDAPGGALLFTGAAYTSPSLPIGTYTYYMEEDVTFGTGSGAVTCVSALGSVTVIVKDTIAPVLGACPADISVNAVSGSGCFTAVSWTAPTATDECTLIFNESHASGSSFGPGSTTVTYTASDEGGNSVSCSFIVTVVPPALSASAVGTDPSTWNPATCSSTSDGSVDLTVTGGCEPYLFLWSNGAGSEDISGLMDGQYSVTIFDANGDFAIADALLIAPGGFDVSAAVSSDVSCFGAADGSITLNATYGFGAISYAWSNGANTDAISGLSAGTYSVTVSSGACSAVYSYSLTQPLPLNLNVTSTDATCFGGSDGTATASATNGTPGYSYAWSNGGNTAAQTGLTAGAYSVTVTDANGCTAVASVNVGEAPQITASAVITDIACFGDLNGSILLTVGGGTVAPGINFNQAFSAPYTSNSNSYSFTGMPTSGYTSDAVFNIAAIGDLDGTGFNLEQIEIFGEGGVSLGAIGATGTFTSQCSATPLTTSLVVTAAQLNAWAADGSIDITAQGTSAVSTTLCSGDFLEVELAIGGGSPYSFLWSTGATSKDLTGITGGTYTVDITDGVGCTESFTYVVNSPSELIISASALVVGPLGENLTCFESGDGAIDLTVSGGTPYAGCPTPYSNTLSHTSTGVSTWGSHLYSFTGTPVCNSGVILTVTSEADMGINTGSEQMEVFGEGGVSLGIHGNEVGGDCAQKTTQFAITGAQIAAWAADGQVDINVVATSGVNTFCADYVDVSLFYPSAGNPYQINWSNGATTEDIVGLSAGTYTVTVSDANGCVKVTSATLTQPNPILMTFSHTLPNCPGTADGTVTGVPTGDHEPITLSWSTGASNTGTGTISGIAAGSYSVTATDAVGCTAEFTYVLPDALSMFTIANTGTGVTCFGGSDGAAYIEVGGGYPIPDGTPGPGFDQTLTALPPSSFSWLSGVTLSFTGVPTGGYTAGATLNISAFGDLDGSTENIAIFGEGGTLIGTIFNTTGAAQQCGSTAATATLTLTAAQLNAWAADGSIDILVDPSSSVGVFCGNDQVEINMVAGAQQAYLGYNYVWSTGASGTGTGSTITGLTAGTYSITWTDDHGCQYVDQYTVVEPPELIAVSGSATVDGSCNGINDAFVSVDVTGGTPLPQAFPGSLTTSFANNNGSGGNMFDIDVKKPMSITGFEVNTSSTSGSYPVDVWYKSGTYVGNTNNAAAWTYAGQTIVNAQGSGQPTQVTLATPIAMSTGINAIFIASTASWNYINGSSVGALWATNGDLDIFQGIGRSTNTFSASIFSPRNFSGTIQYDVLGASNLYSYLWSTGDTTHTVGPVGGGCYQVTVTDANGCWDVTEVCVTGMLLDETITDNSTCQTAVLPCDCEKKDLYSITFRYDGPSGVTLTAHDHKDLKSKNVAATWTNVQNGDIITLLGDSMPKIKKYAAKGKPKKCKDIHLKSDMYFGIDVLDKKDLIKIHTHCHDGKKALLGKTFGDLTVMSITTKAKDYKNQCNAAPCDAYNCNGAIDLAVVGLDPITYYWSNGHRTEDISGVCPGNYYVTITDSIGCVRELSWTVGQDIPNPIILSASAVDNSTCNTNNNCECKGGMTELYVVYNGPAGGTVNAYSDYGLNPADLFQTFSGLNPGDIITVSNGGAKLPKNTVLNMVGSSMEHAFHTSCSRDLKGLTLGNFTVNGWMDSYGNTCGGCDGSIDLTIAGGVAPFVIQWDNGASSEDQAGLCGGDYSVTVTGADGCDATLLVTVANPVGCPVDLSSCPCKGGVVEMNFEYTGANATTVYVYDGSNLLDSFNVVMGTTFDVGDGVNKLPNLDIVVDGVSYNYHLSCSQALGSQGPLGLNGYTDKYGQVCGSAAKTSASAMSAPADGFRAFDLNAYPNPFAKNVTLEYTAPEVGSNVTIVAINGIGQVVFHDQFVSSEEGSASSSISFDNMASGIYYVTIQTADIKETVKLIKQD